MRTRYLFCVLAVACSALAQDAPPTLYDRITSKLARDPKLAAAIGVVPDQLRDARWLLGKWKVTAHVFPTKQRPESTDQGESKTVEALEGIWFEMRDTYDGKTEDVGYLTFNPVNQRWVALAIDKTGNCVRIESNGWEGNRLVFLGENVEIVGERVTLRQTMEKRSDREYRILNEERLSNGQWVAVDEYVYTKQ